MNTVEQYEANNTYFKIQIPDSTGIQNFFIESFDNNIYKSKVDFGLGVIRNVTGTISPQAGGSYAFSYPSLYQGFIRIYSNPLKVKKLFIDAGLDFQNNSLLSYKNVIVEPSIIDYFPNIEYFRFNYYCYNSKNPVFKGKLTGEWATKLGDKLKVLNLSSNYPSDDSTFNLDLIPSNSIVEEIRLQANAGVTNTAVSGNLSNLPNTCKYVNLGGDVGVLSSINSVNGIIPNTVEVFVRYGRNTIFGNVADLNPDLKTIIVQGSNTITGELVQFPAISNFQIQGNNTISGNLSKLVNATETILLTGLNTISGIIPSSLKCARLYIQGNNTLTGAVPVLSSITNEFNIQGSNSLTGFLDLPNCNNVSIGGQNTISSINLPKVIGVSILGQNTISGDLSTQINPLIGSSIYITGQNTLSIISGVFSRVYTVTIGGYNTLTGNVLSKFPSAVSIAISGLNTINEYTSRNYPSTLQNIDITGQAALTSAMVDQIFIDLDRDVTTWTGIKRIQLKGSCQPPTSASADARVKLKNKEVTINVNT